MRYLCLIYGDEQKINALPHDELAAISAECQAYCEGLQQNGKCLASEALQPADTATSIRVRNGKVSVTDGPFAETKEQLGGFYLIEAKDLNEAIQIASNIPPARLGTVEVRPIWEDG